MIQVEDVRKSFASPTGRVQAVDGVSFVARDGQITGLLGPNGAGKTTTLRMLYTLMRPATGRVLVDGVDATADPTAVPGIRPFFLQAQVDGNVTSRPIMVEVLP